MFQISHAFPISLTRKFHFPIYTMRIEKAYIYLLSLPHKKRKFENCSSVEHSLRIAEKMTTESSIIIALLHDVLEDFGYKHLQEMKKFCTAEEIKSLQLLTRASNVSEREYKNYIINISKNENARTVKIHDLYDNLQTCSGKNTEKYKKSLWVLQNYIFFKNN